MVRASHSTRRFGHPMRAVISNDFFQSSIQSMYEINALWMRKVEFLRFQRWIGCQSHDESRKGGLLERNCCTTETCSDSRQRFSPVLSRRRCLGVDLGSAPRKWTAEYLSSHPQGEKRVSTHVFVDEKGYMSFVKKNFEFHTLSFSELIQRCSGIHSHPPLIQDGERYYFRSIGENPRKVKPFHFCRMPNKVILTGNGSILLLLPADRRRFQFSELGRRETFVFKRFSSELSICSFVDAF